MILKKQKMKKKNKILIIDGNNMAHRAYHKYSSMVGPKGNSSMIFGLPYILQSLINMHRPNKVYVVFDGGKDKARLKVLPTYKERPHKEDFDYENFIHQKEILKGLLKAYGIPVYFRKDLEADDIIYLLARRFSRKSQVVIVSSDKDFHQLINKDISIWSPNKNIRLTHLNLKKEVGYTPEQCVDYLSLLGDNSDNIPGYKGVGEKTAIKFLNEFSSIESFLESNETFGRIDKKELAKLYKINKLLINIPYFTRKTKLKLRDIPVEKGDYNAKEIRFICSDYNITKLIQPNVMNTYKLLYYDTKGS